MKKGPFKMKKFSGFGNSPLLNNKGKSRKLNIGDKILVGTSALGAFGSAGIASGLAVLAEQAYKSGQKHSGGKINQNQKSIMSEGKKKTKSLWQKN